MYDFLQKVVVYTGVFNGSQIFLGMCIYKIVYTLITMRCAEFEDGTWIYHILPFGITFRNLWFIGNRRVLFILALISGLLASLWIFVLPLVAWYVFYTLGKYYGRRDYSEHVACDMFIPFYTLIIYGKEGVPKWLAYTKQHKAKSTKKMSTKKMKS